MSCVCICLTKPEYLIQLVMTVRILLSSLSKDKTNLILRKLISIKDTDEESIGEPSVSNFFHK